MGTAMGLITHSTLLLSGEPTLTLYCRTTGSQLMIDVYLTHVGTNI